MPFGFDLGALLGGASDAIAVHGESGRQRELEDAQLAEQAQRQKILAEQLRLSQQREARLGDTDADLAHQRKLNELFIERERQRVQNEVDIRGAAGSNPSAPQASLERGRQLRNRANELALAEREADNVVRFLSSEAQRVGHAPGSRDELAYIIHHARQRGVSHELAAASYDRLFGTRKRDSAPAMDFSNLPDGP